MSVRALVFAALVVWLCAGLAPGGGAAAAVPFAIGAGPLTELWVDPVNGNDERSGASRAEALRTITEAWNRIPRGVELTQKGYRLQLTAGQHITPNYWEQRYGSFAAPIILNAVDGAGTAVLPAPTFFDVRHLYLLGLKINGGDGGDGMQCEKCRYLLLRQVTIDGNATRRRGVQEGLKVNQSQYVFVEDSDISGGGDNGLDFVAVQYGHIINSRIHDAEDWCGYVKGGAFDITVEGNRFYDCNTGGFTVGQGTGVQFLVPPFLHYEGSHVRVINNLVHDVAGAAFGVNGGYNVTIAYNTAWRVGARSHVLEVVYGSRSCDGAAQSPEAVAACQAILAQGGWGTTGEGGSWIPNRNVQVLNNVIYNPPGHRSQHQHFDLRGPVAPPGDSNVPNPARGDDHLVIRGNVIWNGPADLPLGIEGSTACTSDNPSCNVAQLRAENAINTVEPAFVDLAAFDVRPAPGSSWISKATYPLPSFTNTDRPTTPLPPAGPAYVALETDRYGTVRTGTGPAGAAAADHTAMLTVVEYHHPGLNHYFMTGNAGEQLLLESTTTPTGWQRTGASFRAGVAAGNGRSAVWRFYGDPKIGPNSHFYTASTADRDLLSRLRWQTPDGQPRWNYELAAFALALPEGSRCASGQPVTRLYNNGHPRGDPNHRFTTDSAVVAQMTAAGWVNEGIAFCTAE